MTTQGTNIRRITGEVFVKQGFAKKQVRDSLKLKEKAEAGTGANSYASVNDNPSPESGKQSSGATLFPNSKIVVHEKRGYIEKIEVVKGIVNAYVAPGKRVFTQVAEFGGGAWVDVSSDGSTMIAHTRETIYNRKTRRAVTLDVNQQVLVTEDNIGEVEPMDQRFYKAQEIMFNLGAFIGAEMYRQVSEKADVQLDAYLSAMKVVAEKTGQDFEKIKEEARQSFLKQKQWSEAESEKCRQEAEKIASFDAQSSASLISINKSIKYNDVMLNIISVKKELKNEKQDLFSINMEAKNVSPKQIFVFWNEEARLINGKGDVFPADDYNLETSYSYESQAKGHLFIPVNKHDKKFILQFGKKSLPKVEVELDLSKTNKEGD